MDIYHKALQKYWGYTQFRPLQEEIIHSVCSGRDTLGLMPTGGGKSITFQVPAITMQGICLVITPLIALMKDQIDNLRHRGIRALAVYSGMTRQEIITTLENAILGDYKFLYVSPERLGTDLFISKLREMNVSMLVVDESHCISQWGYDFRPSYLKIANIRELLPNVPVLALTATATPPVIEDIQKQLHFSEKNVYRKSFHRHNLAYIVRQTENKETELTNILNKMQGSAIVYVRSRKHTKEIAEYLSRSGINADYYHAGIDNKEKEQKQNAWKNGQRRVIVATNAFGMGIDKSDVRSVIHFDLPNSIEEYFQEAGRAGRDEKKSYAIILYNSYDSSKLKKRITDEYPDREYIENIYQKLAYFFQIAEGYGTGMIYDFDLHKFCATYKLPILPTHNALKILDLAGYIEYADEIDNRSRLIFLIYRDELYSYDFNTDTDQVIQTTLRLYTGLFTNYVTIDEGAIAIRSGKSRTEVYEILKILSKRKIIDYIPHKKTPLITYTQPRIEKKYLSIPQIIYEDRKQRFEKRIIAISEYAAQNETCRSQILLSYFGETESCNCGICDVCIQKNIPPLSDELYQEIKQELQNILNKKINEISQIINMLSKYGKKQVIQVIRFEASKGEIIIEVDKIRIKNNNL